MASVSGEDWAASRSCKAVQQRDAGELLAQVIVQVVADVAAFPVADVKDLFFEFAALGDVLEPADEAERAAGSRPGRCCLPHGSMRCDPSGLRMR